MVVYGLKSRIGWSGDNGLGENLISQIERGEKTAVCSFKEFSNYEELVDIYSTKGKLVTVENYKGEPKCNVKVLEVFETDFHNPDIRVVQGEGYGNDVELFKEEHRKIYAGLKGNNNIPSDAKITVELFELVS